MNELGEVKPEPIDESDDVEAPNYTIVGRLKRKIVDDSNLAPKVAKQEPLDSNLAPKQEPLEDDHYKTRNLAPFFEEGQVKQEVEEGYYETHDPILENDTISGQRAPFSLGLEMTEVKEEAPSRNQDFRYNSWAQEEKESRDDPYEVHPPAVLNEPKLEEPCTSQETLWARVKEEEEPEYEYEEYETSGYQLGEPKVEKPNLSTGPASDLGYPLPKYTIWDQKGPSTSQGMYAPHGSSLAPPVKEEEGSLDDAPGSEYEVPERPTLEERQSAYCCLCGAIETPQHHLTNVHFKSELLILAVGRTMAGKLTVQKGQELMTRTQSSYSCQEHYREANEMVENGFVAETPCTSIHLTVMNKICPQMTMERFRQRCLEFHKWHRKKEPAVTSHCEICNLDQHRTKMTSVSHKSTKYLLAIADMLQGYRKPAQAVSFASGTHAKKVCIIHFQSTLNVILTRLNLKSATEQPLALHLEKLMTSVRMVWKDCKTKFFWSTVRRFAAMHQTLEPLMATTPRPPVPVFLCSLCSKNSPFVRPVHWRNTKLVLAVGACLSKHTTPGSAEEFVARKAKTLVCRSHFNFSIPSILGYLQIESLSEPPATKLASHVTSLVHKISFTYSTTYTDFVGIVSAFAKYHQLATTTSRPSPPPPRSKPSPPATLPVSLCSLCSKNSRLVREVHERNTKLVLAVAACLSNHTTPSCAKKFVAGDETTALVCGSHFDTSIHQILTTLQIKWLNDSPATGPALNVMSLVHLISGTRRIEYRGFIGMIAAFIEDHQLALNVPRSTQEVMRKFQTS